uniref:Uncharacterized protein n=2 Tax=Cuerna arida TaxID=1464854 RepID=A0A1B6EUQ9_9HEMI
MRDVARGYVTTLFADVYDDKLLVSTVSQNVLVLYPAKLPCIPSVRIENCQSNYNKRRKHRENFSMILKSHVSIVRDGTSRSDSEFRVFSGCPETNNYVWEAWRIVPNLDIETAKADISAFSYDWHLKPFMFTPAIYLIRLSVSSQLSNFAKCYLEIVPENVLLSHWFKSGSKSRVPVSEHRSHHRRRKRMKRKRSSFRNGTEDFD